MTDSQTGCIIDISVPISIDRLALWPGSARPVIDVVQSLSAGESANVSLLSCDVHTGTHVDAPRHFLQAGCTIENIGIERCCGMAWVVDLTHDISAIDANILDAAEIPIAAKRVLFRTKNSERWHGPDPQRFIDNFIGLTVDGAQWLLNRDVELVGIDYLSIAPYGEEAQVHRVLLGAEVVIVETLDLIAVCQGWYELFCVPLAIVGAEAAPARAFLRTLRTGSPRSGPPR